MLHHFFKIAFRHLLKHKKQTIFNILGLAVGFACFVFFMSIFETGRPYDFPASERSFTVGHIQRPNRNEVSIEFIRNNLPQFPQIEQFALYKLRYNDFVSTTDDEVVKSE